jgi:hypothetical protein
MMSNTRLQHIGDPRAIAHYLFETQKVLKFSVTNPNHTTECMLRMKKRKFGGEKDE